MNPVAEVSAAQAALEVMRVLPRTLVLGRDAMVKAGKTYLPQHPAESFEAWNARRKGSFLLPAYRDAVDLACGLIFRKNIIAANTSAEVAAWLENVDLAGRSITQFAESVLRDAFNGVSYIATEYPRMAPGATLKQERDAGARPYLIHIKSEQVLGWRTQMVNGRHVLTQFRYKESTTEADGLFGSKEVERIRVLEPGMVSVYVRTAQKDDWVLDPEASGITSLGEVPVTPIYTGRSGYLEGKPPMLDLAWKNVEHWQSASDQRNILHVVRVPLLALIGADDTKDVIVGPQNVLMLPQGADAKWVEHTGKAIEAGRVDLQDLEAQMQRMAGRMLDKGVVKTATEAGMESTQAMSRIQAWALGLQAGLNQAWFLAGKWIGQDLGTLEVNTDVDTSKPDATFLTEIRNAVAGGLLTKETYLKILMSAEVLPEGFDLQEELDRLEIQAPTLEVIPPRVPKTVA